MDTDKIHGLGRATPEFRQKVQDKLNDWFGAEDKYESLMQWYDEGTAYVCVRSKTPTSTDWDTGEPKSYRSITYFFRLFEIGGKMEISQDRKIED